MSTDQLLPVLLATLRVSVPLLLAALAGLFSERSGIVDIGLEGKMLAGAFTSAAVTVVTGEIWLGLLAAIGVAALLGLLHGYVCIAQRGNQVVSGMAINILASGLTVTLGLAWFAQGGRTPPLPEGARFPDVLGLSVLAYPAFALVPLSAWVLARTRFGLRLRAVGENPAAVDTAGVSVAWLRYRAVLIAGVLCGWAGAYIATAQGAGFVRDMTGGRGYLALAALILGKWRPWPTLAACLFFAAIDAVAIRLQGVALPGIGEVPVAVVQAIPYVVTVVLLAGFVGRAIPPRASGIPYVEGAVMQDLIDAALAVREHAHVPYSRFKVGAAIRTDAGDIFAGCNVENAAYPQGVCAEASAISAMVGAGQTRIREVVVIGAGQMPVTPCGGCRQKLREFAGPDVPIHMVNERGELVLTRTQNELLPDSFGPDHLS